MNHYNPKISIVIPAYNASNYLAEAIESALAQTYTNIEIIVVNDGSKDNGATATVAGLYADKIRYFEKENGGSSSALNRGIREMTGEWFSWLSHDDLYYPEKVEKQVLYLNTLLNSGMELSSNILFTAAERIGSNGSLICRPSVKKCEGMARRVRSFTNNAPLIAEPTYYMFHGCGCLVHQNALAEMGAFDEKLRLLNDVDLWFRLYAAGYRVHFLPDVLVKGRVHGKQVSRSIGFSYHNTEQDMYWKRSLKWLQENAAADYDLFFRFGRNAFLKTRDEEGEEAFDIAAELQPKRKTVLKLKKLAYRMYAAARTMAKEVYMKLKM